MTQIIIPTRAVERLYKMIANEPLYKTTANYMTLSQHHYLRGGRSLYYYKFWKQPTSLQRPNLSQGWPWSVIALYSTWFILCQYSSYPCIHQRWIETIWKYFIQRSKVSQEK